MSENLATQDETQETQNTELNELTNVEVEVKKSEYDWSTIHIFGYGEVQLISKEINKKCHINALHIVQHIIDMIYAHKPLDNDSTKNYHAINIFNNMHVDWQTSEKNTKGWRVNFEDIEISNFDILIKEINEVTQ